MVVLLYLCITIVGKLDCLTENFKLVYMETRCQPVKDQWPPNQPTTIVNVALIHLEGEQTQQELIDMSMRNVSAVEKLSYHHPRVTKRITDIFGSSHKRILIEGAPGIGKTVLVKEIAYCWASGEILIGEKLFLLFIRDPDLHRVKSINDLVYYLNNDYLSDSEAKVAADELRKSKGSGIVFVIDGYDECPCYSKLKGFVDKLVEKKFLPMCMVVITSRPTASLLLRQLVDQRIEILGLAKKEQEQYISESLKGLPEMITKLQEYLKQQPIINSLLYVPLHLAILLFLFKQNSLPETLTEMNEYFIVHTIYRHLSKQRQLSFMKICKIADLPEPELTTVYQLSILAYEGLCTSQLMFTYEEIKAVCPKVDETPGAISGFGLLQTVEGYHQKGAGKALSLNFLHFTMQEYLAALHVSSLPSKKQSSLIENTFFDRQFNFMWIMYVGIVGPQAIDSVVNESLFGNNYAVMQGEYNILAKKRLFIFQCYLEGKNVKLIPKLITSIFSDGNIDLSTVTLLPHHIMSLTVFMMKSTTHWKSLNLNSCFIGNNSMSILAKFFVDFKETTNTIKHLTLRNNNLTLLWGTYDFTDQEYDQGYVDVLQSLEDLDISFNLICDREILSINDYLKINSTLSTLNLSNNNITDEGAKTIAKAIQVNKTLQELNISKNWISKEGVMRIVEACTINRALHKLVCTYNNLSKSGLAAINEYIRKENAVQIFDASWNNAIGNKYGHLAINTVFRLLDISEATFQLSDAQQKSGNDFRKEFRLADEITELKYRREFLLSCVEESKHLNLRYANLSDVAQMGIISDCLKLNKKITEANLCRCQVSNEGIKVFVQAVEVNTTLQNLDISYNAISDDGVLFISNCLKINHTLRKLNVSGNDIGDEGIMKFSDAICVNKTLKDLNMSRNRITDEGANELSKAIQVNKTLEELNISKNCISKEGVMRIVEACTKNRTLYKLVCTHNNLSKSGLAAINEFIRKENAVQMFDASWNNTISSKDCKLAISTIFHLLDISKATFQLSDVQQKSGNDSRKELWPADEITELKYRRELLLCCVDESEHLIVYDANLSDAQIGIISGRLKLNKKITKINLCRCRVSNEGIKVLVQAVKVNTTLQNLDISYNAISDNGVLYISDFLKFNHTLCKLSVSGNDIGDEGIMKFSDAICVNKTLKDLNMSRNRITNEGANELSKAVQVNKTLEELNISKNWISKEGVMRIVEACTINRTLHKLVCTHNNLSKSGLAAINEFIRKENAIQIFDASWNDTIGSNGYRLAIITIFQLLDIRKATFQLSGVQQKLQSGKDSRKELWCADEITELRYRKEFVLCCVDESEHLNVCNTDLSHVAQIGIISDCLKLNKKITELNLCCCEVSNEGIKILVQAVEISTTLQKLDISNNAISDDGILSISNFLKTNHTLCKLNVSDNDVRDEGITKFSEAICVNTTLKDLNMSRNRITDKEANELSKAIRVNETLQELNISKNLISKEGVMRIVEACTINRTLHKLVCTHNNLSKSGLAAINEYIRKENAVQIFDASWNTIGSKYGHLAINTIFQLLDISKAAFQLPCIQQKLQSDIDIRQELWPTDEITELKFRREFLLCCVDESEHLNVQSVNLSDAQMSIISDCLKLNKKIIEINLCSCQVSNEGIKLLIRAIKVSTTLQNLDISNNKMFDDGVLSISNFLKFNSTLCKLNVSGNYIEDEGTKKISEAICVNTTLQDLNMCRNGITDEGANKLSKAIQVNTTLQELNISKNWISKEGVMRIVEACTTNRTLYKLVCTHNNLAKSGLAAINEFIRKENAVQMFEASWNTISTKGGELAINTIFQLYISKVTFQLSGVQQKLQSGYDTREELWFCDWGITKLYWREFLKCCIVEGEHLNVHNVNVSDVAQMGIICDGLKLNKKITKVNLCNCQVTNEGIKILAQAVEISTTLKKLDVSNNTISNDGVLSISNFLKTNHTLCKLNVSGNDIGDEGIIKFSEAICVNATLKDLNMSRNKITDEGANKLSKAIQVNTTLQELNISKNWISKQGVMRIVEACTINRTLHKIVCTHNNLSESGLAAISEYIRKENAVQIFHASWNTIATKDGQLAINTIYQLLDISKATFELSGVQQNLQSGNDSWQEIWYADEINELKYRREFLLRCVDENEHLNVCSANLSDVAQIGIIGDCLKLNKKITEVNLCRCRVSNEGIKVLLQAVEVNTLQNLDISYNSISDDGVLSISDFLKFKHSLCKLNVSGNDLRDKRIIKFSEAICVNTTLKDLNMSRNRITDEGANKLSKAIQVNKTLQELNISKNWISKEGVMRIVEACTINRTLHKLVCTHNNLSKSGLSVINEYIRKENAVQIFDASWNNTIGSKNGQLAINTIFQLLDISKATFEVSGVQQKLQSGYDTREELWPADEINELKYRREFILHCVDENEHLSVCNANLSDIAQVGIISDCLKLNKEITEANLCSCRVSNEGIKLLMQAVEVNTTLQKLDISNNAISDDSVLSISNFLKTNHTLCKLNVSGNDIGDEGIIKFSEAICVNTTLKDLNMSRNRITDEGANELSKAIQVNTTLQELNISKNWISKEGVMRIVEACTINRTLHKLVCTHNNLSKSGLAAINEYIRKENAVQIFHGSWNTFGSKGGELVIRTNFQLLGELQSNLDIIQEEFWLFDSIGEKQYRMEFLHLCVEECRKGQILNLTNMKICDFKLVLLNDYLKFNSEVSKLDLSRNYITNEGIDKIRELIQVISKLQCLNISHNILTDNGISTMSGCLMVNNTLCKLNLSSNYITDEGAKRLAEAIQLNTTLSELNVSENWISKEGVMRIVEACTINRTLYKLVCTHNNLSKSGLAAINDYIRKENAVQIFDASWNTIGSKGGKLAIETTFRLIDLHKSVIQLSDQQKLQSGNDNNGSQEELWFAVEEFLQSCVIEIQYLNAQFVNLSDPIQIGIISDGLYFNKNIIEVNVCGCEITNEGIKILVQAIEVSTTLQNLDISSNVISDDGIYSISNFLKINNTLCKLSLSGNEISDEGTIKLSKAICINTTLQNLNIAKNIITDEGAKGLAEAILINMTLQELNISKNWISKGGLMRIVEACTRNRTLHKLVCTHNNLSKSGLAAINEYIRKENAVQVFDASWNSIGSKYGKMSLKANFQLLDIQQKLQSGNDIQEDSWLITDLKHMKEFLPCCLEQQHINLTGTTMSNDELEIFCNCLRINSTVTELNLSSNNIDNKRTKKITEAILMNTTLHSFDISQNMISDNGLLHLCDFAKINSTLYKLNLSANRVTDGGALRLGKVIQVNKTLQELNISKNWISKEGVMRIVKACTVNRTLHKLVCTHNNLSKSELAAIIEHIRKENAVQIFDASWNSIIACGWFAFRLITTTFLSLKWSPEGWKTNSINYNKQVWLINNGVWYDNIQYGFRGDLLIELNFLSYSIASHVLIHVIQGAMQIDTLQKLNIPYNEVCDEGAIAFSERLKTNTTLTILGTSKNNITCDGAIAIAEALKVNNTLEKLNISLNKIFDDGAIAFSECLKTNTTLIELDLSGNEITYKGASAIAKALIINNTLRKLNISNNLLSDDGAIAFSECLKTNTTLIELDLSGNEITYKGASAIAKALIINNTLRKLNISNNLLSDDGAIAFSECLKTNTTLIELDLSGNYINIGIIQSITPAIRVQ